MSPPSPTVPSTAVRLSRLLAVPALLATGAVLTACGSSGSPANAAAAEGAAEQTAEARFADFARCLREHGVNAEIGSGPNGGHAFKIRPGNAGAAPAAMEAAQKACARYRPEPKHVNLSPQQKVQVEERLQRFARCMREHGIKVEVSTAGGGVQIGIRHAGSGGPNPESPGFKAAQNACQKLLPKPPGGREGPFATKSAGSEPAPGGR